MLKKFKMEYCKLVSTPVITTYKISKDDQSLEADGSMYRSMVGILFYVTASRLYVMQGVGLVAIFQSAPKESHVMTIKIILRYLKGTMDFGIWYPKERI
jgi:hypothetical protein